MTDPASSESAAAEPVIGLPAHETSTLEGTEAAESEHHGLLVQAPIPPLDPNGTVVTTVGTAVFAVAAIVLFLLRDRLAAAGDSWWLAIPIAGVALGLIGIAYCWRRRGTTR